MEKRNFYTTYINLKKHPSMLEIASSYPSINLAESGIKVVLSTISDLQK